MTNGEVNGYEIRCRVCNELIADADEPIECVLDEDRGTICLCSVRCLQHFLGLTGLKKQ